MPEKSSIDGTTTDVEIANANNELALQFDGITTSNIIEGRNVSVSLNNTALKKLEEKEKNDKSLSWFERLLNWLFPTDEELKTQQIHEHSDKITKELADMGLLTSIDPDGEVKINKNSKVQIISMLADKHFTTAVLDNENKALILMDPNGHILDTQKFKNCKTKADVFVKLFGVKEAQRLIKEGYTICDGNHNKGDIITQRETDIFGKNIAINDGQKNGEQTKNGACGPVCHMMVRNYLEERFNPQHQSLKDIIQTANKNSVSTTDTIKTELSAVKNKNIIKPNFKKIIEYRNQQNRPSNQKAQNNTHTLNLDMQNTSRNTTPRQIGNQQQRFNGYSRF